MTKHLFSDIDGTLFKDKGISKPTIKKIKDFISKGNKFYLATGRMDYDIKYLNDLLELDISYRVSQNGAVITNSKNEIVRSHTIPKEVVKEIANYLFSLKDIRLEVSTITERFSNTEIPSYYPKRFADATVIDPNLLQRIGVDLDVTIFITISEDEHFFGEVREYINKNFSNHVQAIMTSLTALEILNKDASKGNAVEYIMEKDKLNIDDIYVVGDAENDLSMFKYFFNNSFAMKEAKPHVYAKSKYGAYLVGDLVDYINDPVANKSKVNKKLVRFKNSVIAYVDGYAPSKESPRVAWDFVKLGASGLKTNQTAVLKDIKKDISAVTIASCYDESIKGAVEDNIDNLIDNKVDVISFNITKVISNNLSNLAELIAHIKDRNSLAMATIYDIEHMDFIKDYNFDAVCIHLSDKLTESDISLIKKQNPNVFLICDGNINTSDKIISCLKNGADSTIVRCNTEAFEVLYKTFEIAVKEVIKKQYDNIPVNIST